MARVITQRRLSPFAVQRPRLDQWLSAYSQYPVRLILAPAGCGKSTLLTAYALGGERDTRFCALPKHCDISALYESIGCAMHTARAPESYDELLTIFAGSPSHCFELVVDDADNCDEQALHELCRLVEDVGNNVTFIYSARSRDSLNANDWIARGVAAVCDAEQLSFDVADTALLAAAFGIEATDLDLRRLTEETDGWALAVTSTIRIASAEGETLARSYAAWRERFAGFLFDFVGAELERAKPDDAELFWGLMKGSTTASTMRLRSLASRGLFVRDRGGENIRLFLPLQADAAQVRSTSAGGHARPMHVTMFRSFSATINGHAIPWVRRRDQQIIKYLLLKPDGTASRLELAQVFWPDAPLHLATQSVRTACSTIRKAIAAIAGYSQVENYFRTSSDIKLDLTNVLCDALRFRMHVKDGQTCLERGDRNSAIRHFGAAEKLYTGALLEFEAPEPWFAQPAAVLHERFLDVLETIAEFYVESGEIENAERFVARAAGFAPDKPGIVRLKEVLRLARTGRAVQARSEHGTVTAKKAARPRSGSREPLLQRT